MAGQAWAPWRDLGGQFARARAAPGLSWTCWPSRGPHRPVWAWSFSLRAWLGGGRLALGLPSPPSRPTAAFQRCRVRKSMPAIWQARRNRAPAVCAVSMSRANHSASPLWKITAIFFNSTSRSRSNSLMRFCRVVWLAGWPRPLRALPVLRWHWCAIYPVRPATRRVHGTRRFCHSRPSPPR